MKKLIHLNAWIEEALAKQVKREASIQGVSVSYIIRKALGYYVKGEAGYNRRGAR